MLDTLTSIASFATENIFRANPIDVYNFSKSLETLLSKAIKEKNDGAGDIISGANYPQMIESEH